LIPGLQINYNKLFVVLLYLLFLILYLHCKKPVDSNKEINILFKELASVGKDPLQAVEEFKVPKS